MVIWSQQVLNASLHCASCALELLDSECNTEHLNTITATFGYDRRVVGKYLVRFHNIDREEYSGQERIRCFDVQQRRKGHGALH